MVLVKLLRACRAVKPKYVYAPAYAINISELRLPHASHAAHVITACCKDVASVQRLQVCGMHAQHPCYPATCWTLHAGHVYGSLSVPVVQGQASG